MSLIIFQQQVSTAATELVAQEVQKFNAAAGGTLVMGGADHIGDYIEQTMWQLIGGLAQRRNAYVDKKVNSLQLNQILDRMVKIDGRIGPVEVTPTMMKRLGKDTAEAASVVAAQSAEAILQDYLNTIGGVLKTAISTESGLVTEQLDGKAPTIRLLNKGVRAFGDAYSRIQTWLMDGSTYNDLIDSTLENANRLYQIGNVSIMSDGLGRRFVISDIPALAEEGKQHILGLTVGAGVVQTTPLIMKAQDVLGNENLKALMQGEYDFTIGIKGYQWSSNTIKSPTDAQLLTAGNWKCTATSLKDTAGVLVTTGSAPEEKSTQTKSTQTK